MQSYCKVIARQGWDSDSDFAFAEPPTGPRQGWDSDSDFAFAEPQELEV